MTKKKETPKVHQVLMVDETLLSEHPKNSQRQSRHVFSELKTSIKENGFDENLIVIPRDDGQPGYWIVSGNHRFRAGKAEGINDFPCVVRNDWSAIEAQIQLVRRNQVRGTLDKEAFTAAINSLREDAGLELDALYERMGFEDSEQFSQYYKEEKEEEEKISRGTGAANAASQVKMVDDLGLIISTIFEQYGDTVPHSFLIFPAGGKHHMFVQSSPTLRATLSQIAERCIKDGLDINIALGGLLQIGMAQTNFVKGPVKAQEVRDHGTSADDGGAAEFAPIKVDK